MAEDSPRAKSRPAHNHSCIEGNPTARLSATTAGLPHVGDQLQYKRRAWFSYPHFCDPVSQAAPPSPRRVSAVYGCQADRKSEARRQPQIRSNANWHLVSRERAAELMNVSERSIARASEVQEKGAPELIAAVDQGRVSVSAAANIAARGKAR